MNKEIFVKLLAQRQFKAVRSILDVMNEVDGCIYKFCGSV